MQETRKVSFKQEEIQISSTKSEMVSAETSIQETQVQEQTEQQGRKLHQIFVFSFVCLQS